ncbi:MAG: bacitracin resistance protein BacA [Acidobacteriota bacterium]|nr:bacitracin resistance protein BacA [Acidobacteriota bacterium]
MLPEQMQIIKATVPLLQQHGTRITQVFYSQMFAEHPELRQQFDMAAQADGSQQKRLAGAILAYAANIDRLEQLGAAVERIAQRHVETNVLPEQYPIVGRHLLAAIQTVLGDVVTPEILDAWSTAYQELADILILREQELYDQRTAAGDLAGVAVN